MRISQGSVTDRTKERIVAPSKEPALFQQGKTGDGNRAYRPAMREQKLNRVARADEVGQRSRPTCCVLSSHGANGENARLPLGWRLTDPSNRRRTSQDDRPAVRTAGWLHACDRRRTKRLGGPRHAPFPLTGGSTTGLSATGAWLNAAADDAATIRLIAGIVPGQLRGGPGSRATSAILRGAPCWRK